MSLDLLVVCLFMAPLVLWAISNALFWCFCWCFCTVENYFQDRFMQRTIANLRRLERLASERDVA